MVHAAFILLPVAGFLALAAGNPTDPVELLSSGATKFTLDLLRNSLDESNENVVFSPLSIGVMLSALQQGAQENSATELEAALGTSAEVSRTAYSVVLPSLQGAKTNVTLEWANRLFLREDFQLEEDYKKISQDSFHSDVKSIDFTKPSKEEAANEINKWVSDATHGQINDVVKPALLDENTVMVMVNAIYFKGIWNNTFDKTQTRKFEFYRGTEVIPSVFFMRKSGDQFNAGEDETLKVKWLELPYEDEQFSMLLILPNENDGLQKVVDALTVEDLKKMMSNEEMRFVTMSIPKFKITWTSSLQPTLEKMGVKDIFTDQANLAGLSKTHKNLRVSQIIHKANIEVDEDGTVAAGATLNFIETLSLVAYPQELFFVADHPFLAFIIDKKNKMPIFAVKVKNPETVGVYSIPSIITP